MHLPSRPERSESHLLPRSINGSNKSALLVENSDSLLTFLKRSLNDEGYAVRTATNSQEGLRLYHDCGPFNVVLINYCVPRSNGDEIDCREPQTHGIDLAMAIRQSNPLQGIVIAAFDS
jgi:CheY-like chemotaxis protein